jgi:hypothetical protein
VKPKRSSYCAGNGTEVIGITRHDKVAASECACDHGCVDDVATGRASAGHSGSASTLLVEVLDSATSQQAGQLCLRAATPCLAQNARRHDRALTALQGSRV